MHVRTSCYSDEPYRLFEWQHLAAVKDGAQLRLYVGGKLVAEAEDENELQGDLRVLIGRKECLFEIRSVSPAFNILLVSLNTFGASLPFALT